MKGAVNQKRLMVIGLDCLPPDLVFNKLDLPHLRRLMKSGVYGELRSTIPPITVPAWISMTTGKDPGELGLYGFRNRKEGGYGWFIANSQDVKESTLWDVLGKNGKNVIVSGVPLTYPPKPVNGCLISDFMTPSASSSFTYPAALKEEVLQLEPDYSFDVKEFRTEDRERVLRQIYAMTEQHFRVSKHLLAKYPWDFFMMVEIGPDRLHHAFWKYQDPLHRSYAAGSPFENAVRDYYIYLDKKVGELLEIAGNDTSILVVSDHGAQRMDGGVAINEWLIQQGYLVLKKTPGKVIPLEDAEVDWKKTKVWGAGGYYARLFVNVRGREAEGIVSNDEVEPLLSEISRKLIELKDPQGNRMSNTVYRPREIYKNVTGSAPDLIVYLGNLLWRSIGSVGHNSVFVSDNDIGPDDANHAPDGIFILREPQGLWGDAKGYIGRKKIYDIVPLVCRMMNIPWTV